MFACLTAGHSCTCMRLYLLAAACPHRIDRSDQTSTSWQHSLLDDLALSSPLRS